VREIHRLAVVGTTALDGTGRPPLPSATIVIEGTTILAVGPAATTHVP